MVPIDYGSHNPLRERDNYHVALAFALKLRNIVRVDCELLLRHTEKEGNRIRKYFECFLTNTIQRDRWEQMSF